MTETVQQARSLAMILIALITAACARSLVIRVKLNDGDLPSGARFRNQRDYFDFFVEPLPTLEGCGADLESITAASDYLSQWAIVPEERSIWALNKV